MSFLSKTLGKISAKYRTLSDWAVIYSQIVTSKPITKKTISNREHHHKRILAHLGGQEIGLIRPHDIAGVISRVYETHPHTAKRMLIEVRDMFQQAVDYGWIDRNPAASLKPLKVKVSRLRLTLKEWLAIRDYSEKNSPPWVSRMVALALVTGQRRGDLMKMKFSDVWSDDGVECLHVIQDKTGARISIPLDLRIDVIGMSVRDAIESCRSYAKLVDGEDSCLVRKSTGKPLVGASMSWRFEQAREGALGLHKGDGAPPSLHECRSLSERIYREQGINTMTLLGHTSQGMTDLYNDDRGLSAKEGRWKVVSLPPAKSASA